MDDEDIIVYDDEEMLEKIFNDMKEKTTIDNYKIGYKNESCDVFDSKIGGIPYWDTNKEYPKTKDGENLILLAQINFDKEQFDNERLPKKGILQFFVKNNWLWKEDEEYKVIYHENINYDYKFEDIENLNIKTTKDDDIDIDVHGEYKMIFHQNSEAISIDDFQFRDYAFDVCSKYYDIEDEDFIEKYDEFFDEELRDKFDVGDGSKLLGYPGFCQYDPRERIKNGKDLKLLLQLDSYQNITPVIENIELKDGILNFFITDKDLENLNFDNVFMNGDFH